MVFQKSELYKLCKQEINNFKREKKLNFSHHLSSDESLVLSKLKKKGYCIIENFYTVSDCQNIIAEIDKIIEKYNDKIWKDKDKSDHRIFGADAVSPIISDFYNNKFITKIVQSHEGSDKMKGFTLAARLEHKKGNSGSGGGWHRDWANRKQTKAILYLTDVNEYNGPFQYIESSHRSVDLISKNLKYKFQVNKNRFSDEEMEQVINDNPSKLKTFTAKAGTLIFVNTRGIHRGMPINEGNRYALTNYYWFNMPIAAHISKLTINHMIENDK